MPYSRSISSGSIPRRSQFDSHLLPRKYRNEGGGRSQGSVWGVSAVSCRMKEIEDVGMVKPVYIGGLLRVGSDSLLMHVWRSVGDGFTGKGESDIWVVMKRT